MENISMIACIGKENELGYQNQFLWYIPKNAEFFKEHTAEKPLIMGRKTYESLREQLKDKNKIVLSTTLSLSDKITIYRSMKELLDWIQEYRKEVMVIGGATTFKHFMPYAEKLYLTKVGETAKADIYFPPINSDDWRGVVLSEGRYDNLNHRQLLYTREK